MRLMKNKGGGSESGVSLVMVGLAVSVLATLSVSMLIATKSTTDEKMAHREDVAALFAAEAGLAEAVFDLNSGGNGIVASQQAPAVMAGDSAFWVDSQDLPNGMKMLTATGLDNQAGMRIELTMQQQANNMWVWGAFGDEELTMDSNSRVDSYDSTLGTYASQQVNGSGSSAYALTNGHVGSNGDIDMSQNSSVQGNAVPGPTSSATIVGNAYVTGSTTPNTGTVALPALNVPSFGTAGDVNYTKNNPIVLASGDYEFDDMYLGSQAVLTIHGPARVVVDNLELRSNSQIVVDGSAGPVEFFVRDDFVMNSNTQIASTTLSPLDIAINLESDNIINPTQNVQLSEVTFESNSSIYGTLFAPNASVNVDSNFELVGAVVARQVHLDSWSRIHFDEALVNVNNNNVATTWQTICWRKVAFQP